MLNHNFDSIIGNDTGGPGGTEMIGVDRNQADTSHALDHSFDSIVRNEIGGPEMIELEQDHTDTTYDFLDHNFDSVIGNDIGGREMTEINKNHLSIGCESSDLVGKLHRANKITSV